ncbi:MAG: alpha/beta hydrolase family protein [Aridibacter sp.]
MQTETLIQLNQQKSIKLFSLVLFILLLHTSFFGNNFDLVQPQQVSPDLLYENFSKAYSELDANSITSLYVKDAEILNLYDDSPLVSLKSESEIKKYYSDFFEGFIKNKQKLQLSFKIANRKQYKDLILDNGFYKLEIISQNQSKSTHFGKFSTILELVDNKWKFKTDATTDGNFLEFESVNVPLIPKQEEDLYTEFYDDLLGNYVTEDNKTIVIGRSQSRLYAYFEDTQKYRGLSKINATNWTAGDSVISDKVLQKFEFNSPSLNIYQDDKLMTNATKKDLYKTEKINFTNKSGVKLGGTVFIPNQETTKAIVLVHGSGGQDRNGYASIIRLLADFIAKQGVIVLTYDKQGVGDSEGNWANQNFTELAQDSISGIDYLKSRKDLNLKKIGLGGSSQAGWIIAKAVEQSDEIDFALLIGAAGSGVKVVEQNLYNTKVQMQCSKNFNNKQIEQALRQQQYFFDYVLTRKNPQNLDNFTKKLSNDKTLRDWLFPTSEQIDFQNKNQWFTALEINFDPLKTWEKYNKPTLMLFSEFDDSTPTTSVINKLDKIKKNNIQTVVIKNSQHIGLVTASVCKNDLADLNEFSPTFFREMETWLKKL